MRALLFLAVALCLFPVSSSAQTGSDTAAIQKQIDANNQTVGRAIHARDYATLEKLWSPHMVVNAPENTIRTRDDVLAAMRSGGLNYTSLKGTTEAFKVFGDIAIEMGHEDFVMAEGPSAGKPLKRRYTNVWQRTESGWMQIARQATILGVDATVVYGP